MSTPESERPESRLAVERRIASFVSRVEALALVRELAAIGPRTGGTALGDRAAALLAARMRDLGLETSILDDPPTPVHQAISWSVSLDGVPLASAYPWIHSPSLTESSLPLVVEIPGAGAGPEESRAAALLTSSDLEVAWPAYQDRGLAAVLTDFPGRPDAYRDWAFVGDLDLSRGRPGFPVFGLSGGDAARLREALRARRDVRVDIALAARNVVARPRTVVGILPGAGALSARTFLVCAHGDADGGGPGADDNASGVAAVLEVARGLQRALRDGLLPESRPGVSFIVWGKEYHSSSAWVQSQAMLLPRIEAVFNFDQVGTGTTRRALYYEGNDIPWNDPMLRTMEAVAVAHAGEEGFWVDHTSNPSLGDTDAYAFLPADRHGLGLTSVRIPATTVFTAAWSSPMELAQTPGWESPGWPTGSRIEIDYSRFYHSLADTPENTTERTPENIERGARLVLLTVYRLMRGAS